MKSFHQRKAPVGFRHPHAEGGWQKFQWTSPRGTAPITVLCRKWSAATKIGQIITVSATFEQTFGV